MAYISPGDAFSSSFEQQLADQKMAQRQAMLDKLAADEIKQKMQLGEETLEEKRLENRQKIRDQRESSIIKRIQGLAPGDIPDAQLIKDAKDAGVPLRTKTDTVTNPIPQEFGQTAQDVTGTIRYAGSVKDAAAEQDRARQKAFIDGMDDKDPRKAELKQAFEAESAGLKVPAGYFARPPAARQHVIFDPVARKFYNTKGEVITDVPENAIVDRTQDETSKTEHKAEHGDDQLQKAREKAYDEFNKDAKPIEDTINRVLRTTTSLNQNSDIADSTLAEMIVTMTAGGTGSGVRISQPMVDQVLSKSRTKWDSLQIALNRWKTASPDQKQQPGLFFTPEQRQAIRDLAKAYRSEAIKQHKKITDHRHDVDNAASIDEVNKLRTQAQDEIFTEPDDAAGANGLPTVGGMFNGGKVLSVTKKKAQ